MIHTDRGPTISAERAVQVAAFIYNQGEKATEGGIGSQREGTWSEGRWVGR